MRVERFMWHRRAPLIFHDDLLDRGFDPAEARDPKGQWTEGGGVASSELSNDIEVMPGATTEFATRVDKLLNEISNEHPDFYRRANVERIQVYDDPSSYSQRIPRGVVALYNFSDDPPSMAAFESMMNNQDKLDAAASKFVVMHELGHAYDYQSGRISDTPGFRKALGADRENWVDNLQFEPGMNAFHFLLSHPAEIFADTVAHVIGPRLSGNAPEGNRFYLYKYDRWEQALPNVTAFMHEQCKKDGIT